MLDDSILVQATKQGLITINFTSEQGTPFIISLKHVLYVPGLNRRLLSIPSFIHDENFKVSFSKKCTHFHFGDGKTFKLPHIHRRPHQTLHSTQEVQNIPSPFPDINYDDTHDASQQSSLPTLSVEKDTVFLVIVLSVY